jgi:drug/metabolite transporter (DMT)-like permease
MAAVLLACLSAALFGALTVAVRLALERDESAVLGAFCVTTTAMGVSVAAALVEAPFRGEIGAGDLWPFVLAGLIAPGLSQLSFTYAVKYAGPSRTSVVLGVAPLVSVTIALALLGEPFRLALAAGALLIVVGGLALVGERLRPEQFRAAGIGLALISTVCFSTRDNLVRWLAGTTKAAPLAAAAVSLAGGVLLLAVYTLSTPDRKPAGSLLHAFRVFAPSGLLFGLSYLLLFEAYYRGRVTIVAPLVSTESLWGVVLSALLVGRSELIGRRLVGGALLVVAGGALIGATR